jgi:hypothetical protein
MPRQKLTALTVTITDADGTNAQDIKFVPGGSGPGVMDLDQVVALFFGTVAGQTPPEVLGGFYRDRNDDDKITRVNDLWNGTGTAALTAGQPVRQLPAVLAKSGGCVPTIIGSW